MQNIYKKIVTDNRIKQFLFRAITFFVLYTLIWVCHGSITRHLYNYQPQTNDIWPIAIIYPTLIFFFYLHWQQIKVLHYKNSPTQTVLFSIAAIALILAPIKYLFFELKMDFLTSYFIPLYLGYFMMFLAIFGLQFAKIFKKEILICLSVILSYLAINIIIERYWQFFSKIIMSALSFALPYVSSNHTIIPREFFIKVEDFNIFIGPPCTGIYSIVTFSLLFCMSIFFISKNRHPKCFETLLAYLAGIITLFLLNIVRILIIILVGAYHSKDLAIKFFHEYLSAIFLIGIFSLYLYLIIPKITTSINHRLLPSPIDA